MFVFFYSEDVVVRTPRRTSSYAADASDGHWARALDGDDIIQHSVWQFDTEENARSAEATFNRLREMPTRPGAACLDPPWIAAVSRPRQAEGETLVWARRASYRGETRPDWAATLARETLTARRRSGSRYNRPAAV